MWFVLITDILLKMCDQFGSLELRIRFVNEQMHDKFLAIYGYMYEPDKIEILLN